MKTKLSTLTAWVLIGVLTGCATKPKVTEPLAGLAIASALVAAMPLIPVVGVYQVASGNLYREHKREKQLKAKLDPVYEKRIQMIADRDPVADARQAWREHAIAFLPSIPNCPIYSGLEETSYHMKDGAPNQQEIDRSELLRYLQTLMSEDPVQAENKEILYLSDTYNEFWQAGWKYKTAFNRQMVRERERPADGN